MPEETCFDEKHFLRPRRWKQILQNIENESETDITVKQLNTKTCLEEFAEQFFFIPKMVRCLGICFGKHIKYCKECQKQTTDPLMDNFFVCMSATREVI